MNEREGEAYVARLTAPPDPVVLTYGDLMALEAAALLMVGCDLTADPDPYEEEEEAAGVAIVAAAWRKLHRARCAGLPVAVEATMPPQRRLPGDPLYGVGGA